MFWENIKEAITSISSNKMRSLLTMLGIIIGISSVIIITTIGGSIQSTLTATMNSLGGNMVQAYVEARYPENDEDWATWEQPDMTDSDYVTQDMIDGLIEKYPDEVTGVAAQNYLGSGTIKDDADSKNYANVNIDGITPEYLEYMKLEMHAGRNLTKADNQGKKRVCLIADTMAERYFAGKDPIGETLSVATSDGGIFDFVVVGVYVYNQALFGKVDTSIPEKDRVTELMIPLQTCFKLQGTDRTGYDYFNLMIDPLADVNQATTDVLSYFDEMYANNKNFHVSAYNMASDLGMINTVLNVITIAVSGIAADRGWCRRYEYHAGVHHGAYKRDRCPYGAWCQKTYHPYAVCHRGDHALSDRRYHRYTDWYRNRGTAWKSGRICHSEYVLSVCKLYYYDGASFCNGDHAFTVLLYADRCIFRILPGEQGFKDGSHRCIAL